MIVNLGSHLGVLRIGDVVKFKKFSSETGVGNITSFFDGEIPMINIYTKDDTGGHTVTLPVHSILEINRGGIEEVDKPKRYNKRGKLECWDVIIDQEMNFLEGSVLKYLWRYKEKNGMHDLEKAKVYIDKIISELKK
jgi:hypothetical protein